MELREPCKSIVRALQGALRKVSMRSWQAKQFSKSWHEKLAG